MQNATHEHHELPRAHTGTKTQFMTIIIIGGVLVLELTGNNPVSPISTFLHIFFSYFRHIHSFSGFIDVG